MIRMAPGASATVAVPLLRPDTPFALLPSVRLAVPASEPAEAVFTEKVRLLVVVPPALADSPVNPLAVTLALPVLADTSSKSWKAALVTVWLPKATDWLDTLAPAWTLPKSRVVPA